MTDLHDLSAGPAIDLLARRCHPDSHVWRQRRNDADEHYLQCRSCGMTVWDT